MTVPATEPTSVTAPDPGPGPAVRVARPLVGLLRSPWPWVAWAALVASAAAVAVGLAATGGLTTGTWGWFADKLRITLAIAAGVTYVPIVRLAVAHGTTRRGALDGLLRASAVLGAVLVVALVGPYLVEWWVFVDTADVVTRVASPGDALVALLAGAGLAAGFAVTGWSLAAALARYGVGPDLVGPAIVALLPALAVEAAWSLVVRAGPFPGLLFSDLLVDVPLRGWAAVGGAALVSVAAVAGGVRWLRATTSRLPLHGGPLPGDPRRSRAAVAVVAPHAGSSWVTRARPVAPVGAASSSPVRRAAATVVRELGAPWVRWYAVGLVALTVAVTVGVELFGELDTGVWGWVVNHLRFAVVGVGLSLGGALRRCVAHGITRRHGVRGLLLGLGVAAVVVATVVGVGYALEAVVVTALGTATPALDAVGMVLVVPFGALLLAAYVLTGWLVALGFQRGGTGLGSVWLVPALLPAAVVEVALGAGFDLPADVAMLTAVPLPWPAGGTGAVAAVAVAVLAVAAGSVAVVAATRRVPVG